MQAKKRIVKDYDKLPEEVLNLLKLEYPRGFVKHLIKYNNKDGQQVSALPFEVEEIYYLIRMSATEARQIIINDDDYEDGILRDDFEEDVFDDTDNQEEGSYNDSTDEIEL